MKAVILAAGEGRRLEPLTNRRPKPMLPVANRPILEYVLEAVADAGVTDVVLVVGYKRDRIQTHFGNGEDIGVDIEYAVQENQLGTGHAVLTAEDAIDEEFIVLNGDRIIESSVIAAVADRALQDGRPVLSITRVPNARNYGVVAVEDGTVSGITEKPPAYESTADLINAGVYKFDPSIFEELRRGSGGAGELGLTTTLDRLAEDGGLNTVRYRGEWWDVSYPWDLLTVNAALLEGESAATDEPSAVVADAVALGDDVRLGPNASIRGQVALGTNVTVGANAVLENAVVLPDANVGAGAVVRDAIVGENVRIGANVTIVGGEGRMIVGDEVHRDVRLGGVLGDNSRIGGGVVLETGSIVGDQSRVAPGVTVSRRIPPNAEVHRG
ncbi:MAG: sugar phosphate nucleotidyltransferase [Halanaeroarchaeum sp.]